MSDWTLVCTPATNLGAAEFQGPEFCRPDLPGESSPIDAYYELVEHLLQLGTVERLEESETFGRLLILGLVSGVESYLRAVLAGVLRACPVARRIAQDATIPLGALDYYDLDSIELGIFDAKSFASEKEIRSAIKKLLGLDVPTNGTLAVEMENFDVLCHLRHASVHAQGKIGSRSAKDIGLSLTSGQHSIRITYAGLQGAGAMCHRFVRSMNSWLWKALVERWFPAHMMSVWADDKAQFTSLHKLLYSERDAVGHSDAKQHYAALPWEVRMRRG